MYNGLQVLYWISDDCCITVPHHKIPWNSVCKAHPSFCQNFLYLCIVHTHLSPHNMTSEILWSNIFHPLTVDLDIYLPFYLFLPFKNHPISIPVVHTDKVFLDLLEQQGPICCGCVFVISSLAHIHTEQTEKGIHNRRNKALSTCTHKRCSSWLFMHSKLNRFSYNYSWTNKDHAFKSE